jgi:hypothetical protein
MPGVAWWQGGVTRKDFEKRHVMFQQEDKATYINKMLTKAQEDRK